MEKGSPFSAQLLSLWFLHSLGQSNLISIGPHAEDPESFQADYSWDGGDAEWTLQSKDCNQCLSLPGQNHMYTQAQDRKLPVPPPSKLCLSFGASSQDVGKVQDVALPVDGEWEPPRVSMSCVSAWRSSGVTVKNPMSLGTCWVCQLMGQWLGMWSWKTLQSKVSAC